MGKAVRDGEKEVIASFSISPSMRAWLLKASKDNGVPMSAIVRAALRRFSKDQNPDKWKECQ